MACLALGLFYQAYQETKSCGGCLKIDCPEFPRQEPKSNCTRRIAIERSDIVQYELGEFSDSRIAVCADDHLSDDTKF